MNNRVDVDDIIDRFREWLDCRRRGRERGDISSRGRAMQSAVGREFGIIDLVEEFTALRHEVKLQTKSGRGLSEQTETTLAGAQASDRRGPVGCSQGCPGGVDGR